MEYRITLAGRPVPKGRPRTVRTRSGASVTYTPARTTTAEKRTAEAWRQTYGDTQLTEALTLEVIYYYPIPRSWTAEQRNAAVGRYYTARPDIDNLLKTTLDGLNGTAYRDDAQVVRTTATKQYTEGTDGRTEITIKTA